MAHTTLRDRYQKLDGLRSEVLDRAWTFASFTIPRLFPDRYFQGDTHTSHLPELYSSKPGTSVRKLSDMMTNALFPPNDVPFFELKLSPELTEEQREALRNPVQEVERIVLDSYQASNYRTVLRTALEHAIVMGDSLIFQMDETRYKVYHPAHFMIRRDGDGLIKEYWTVDWVVTDLLDGDLKNLNEGKAKHSQGEHEPLYTRIYQEKEKWVVEKEFRDIPIDKDTSYTVLPYYHIGWTPVAGEDYSRSLVEETFGTIRSNEMNEKALVEGTAAGSEGRILIDPASTTTIDDLEGTVNWQVISARPGTIDTFQPNVGRSLETALLAKAKYEAEIDDAFLAASAGNLTQDRTTAFQVNAVASERSQALSGVLSVTEQNLEPSVEFTITRLIKNKKVAPEFKDLMDNDGLVVSISSGIDALGRQADGIRLESMISIAFQTQDPEMLAVLKKSNIMQGIARNSGLDMAQYIYTDQEIAEKQQAQQQQQLQAAAAQQTVESAGAIAEGNLTP